MLTQSSHHTWRALESSMVIGLLCFATWALAHAYRGIFHDAPLYTLQALSHLHPETLHRDVFLKFGSQDSFTIFTSIYARVSQLVGVETAASLLTLLSQMALIGGTWLLARAVMPAGPALLGVAIVIALPGSYGPYRILTYIEPYLTPRMASEALTLMSLAAALNRRYWWAIAAIVAAASFHPIMAAAGIFAMWVLWVGKPWPRLTAALIVIGLLAMTAQSLLAPFGTWGRFDETWFHLVENRSPFLFLGNWRLDDWSMASVPLATLAVAFRVLDDGRARTLSAIVLLSVLGGLLLAAVGNDLLHLVIVTQLQTWRWLWAGSVVAAMLAPQTVMTLWTRGTAGRTTAMLVITAWLFAANDSALMASITAVLSSRFTHRLKANEQRWLFWGACLIFAVAVIWRLASSLEFTDSHYLDLKIPLWMRQLTNFVQDGAAPVAVIAVAWWLSQKANGRTSLLVMGAAAAAACVSLLPQTWAVWSAQEFSNEQVARFAPLRNLIPPASEVFL